MLSERMMAAGAQQHADAAPPFVNKDWLLEQCAQQERVLRLQDGGSALTEEEEARISAARRVAEADVTPTGALRLYKYLGHLFMVRDEHLVSARAGAGVAADQAAHDLLMRTPVERTLASGRRVKVTGRSYRALLLVAAHGARAQMIEAELEALQVAFGRAAVEARKRVRFTKVGRRWRLKMRAIQRRHARLTIEAARQRITMWAHALTADGAAHPPDAPVPHWLGEISAVDEPMLFDGLHEVGPRRIAALVASLPKPKRRDNAAERPDFGPDGLLAAYGYRLKVPAAECFDIDLGQQVAELMIGLPDPIEELGG